MEVSFEEALLYHRRAEATRCTGAYSYRVEETLLKELDAAVRLLRLMPRIDPDLDAEVQLFRDRHKIAPYVK